MSGGDGYCEVLGVVRRGAAAASDCEGDHRLLLGAGILGHEDLGVDGLPVVAGVHASYGDRILGEGNLPARRQPCGAYREGLHPVAEVGYLNRYRF